MFSRFISAAEAGADVAEAKARLAGRSAQRFAAAVAGFVAAGVLIGAGLIGLLIAAYLAMAPDLGRPLAVALVSIAAGAMGAIIWFVCRRITAGPPDPDRSSDYELRMQAAEASAAARSALTPDESDDDRRGGLKEEALRVVLNNPRLVSSAGFALVSVLGPARVVRLVARAAAAGGVLASVAEAMSESHREPPPTPRRDRNAPVEPGANGRPGRRSPRAERTGRRR